MSSAPSLTFSPHIYLSVGILRALAETFLPYFSDVSRNSQISAVVYLRDTTTAPNNLIVMDKSDIFLGSVMITPDLDSPTNKQSWFQLQGVPSGEIRLQVEYSPFRQVRTTQQTSLPTPTGAQAMIPIETTPVDGII